MMNTKMADEIISKETQLKIVNTPYSELTFPQRALLQKLYNEGLGLKGGSMLCYPCVAKAYAFLKNNRK